MKTFDFEEKTENSVKRKRESKRVKALIIRFDVVMDSFLPQFKARLGNSLDVSKLVQILKNSRESKNITKAEERDLWNRIKVDSFSLLFVNAYALGSLCVLFQLELTLLECFASYSSSLSNESALKMPNLLRISFERVLHRNLDTFIRTIEPLIENTLIDWSIENSLKICYGDLEAKVNQIRQVVEGESCKYIYELLSRKNTGLLYACCACFFTD